MLTTKCNLKCKYCFGESLEDFNVGDIDYYLPKKVSFNYNILKIFMKRSLTKKGIELAE